MEFFAKLLFRFGQRNRLFPPAPLAFDGNLEFNGHFEGEIISAGTLLIGTNAILKGDIQANKVILHGKMHGNTDLAESALRRHLQAADQSICAIARRMRRNWSSSTKLRWIPTTLRLG